MLLVISLINLMIISNPGVQAPVGSDNDCGIRSLFLLLRLHGRDPDLISLARSASPSDPAGLSMKELQDCARIQRMPLKGVKLRPREKPSGPTILFFGDGGHGHFIVVRPVGTTGKLVQLLDPNTSPRIMDYEDLEHMPRWTGLALVPDFPNWPGRIGLTLVLVSGGWLGWLALGKWLPGRSRPSLRAVQ